ncbi:MAG: tRNA (adenosine(37)-N6)-threonylcarbamoyltransferase complex transferase subunit TsaD [Rhodobacteraceae bacterium]|nr:tRNA (adenosine(37)-N6)-threonylcarbamoyltransferase complex transferase subunit TsaD [Paracoccaceae bacterium]
MTPKLILGIETSCDDTSIAVVDQSGHVLSCKTASQVEVHEGYGGIYPEFASRAHVAAIIPTVSAVLKEAGVPPAGLAAIGVTRGPGLIGSLLVGIHTASGLGAGWGLPVYGVNHLRGHLRSPLLEGGTVDYPAIVLLASGGHTLLAFMKNATSIELVGTTRDDSVGEAYDKVARMLGLGFPGGPEIDRLAKTGRATIRFPRPMLGKGFEFSFSGLKSSVRRYMEQNPEPVIADVAASFVAACMEVLVGKCRAAISHYRPASLIVVGGVSASPQLRNAMKLLCEDTGARLALPPLKWATDNGAMIAMATFDYIEQDSDKQLEVAPNLPINML